MEDWSYMTVGEYKELKKKAKEYGFPCPWPVQTVKKKKEEKDGMDKYRKRVT